MEENSTISVGDAYRAMFEFLDAYWKRGSRAGLDDPIGCLLSDIQYGDKLGPTKTADPAQWPDFLEAVRKVTK